MFPKTHRAALGVSMGEILAVLAILLIVAAILFPVFQKSDYRPTGVVRDGAGEPILGAALRFRDPKGRLVATVTSDGQGEFRRADLSELSYNAMIDGFALTRFLHRTGGSDIYTFTPLETQIVIFTNEAGKPLPGLAFTFYLDNPTGMSYYERKAPGHFNGKTHQATNKDGVAYIAQVPSGARFKFEVFNTYYAVEKVQTIVDGNTIRYAVTVAPRHQNRP